MTNLDKQIEQVQQVLSDIELALSDQGIDTSNLKPAEYASAIRQIVNTINVENVSFLPVIIFRYAEFAPKKPTGGEWIRNEYTDQIIPPQDWYLDLDKVEDVSFLSQYIYMSTCIFKQDGTKFMDWTTPVRISGKNGKDGKQGNPGPAGNIAGVVIEYNTPIYTVTSALSKPDIPVCSYDIQNKALIIYSMGWSRDTPDEDTLGANILWQSVAQYASDRQTVLCSNPVRISAGNPDVILSDGGFWTEYCFTVNKDDPKSVWFKAPNADPPVPTLANKFLWARDITQTSVSGKHVGPVYLFATYVAGLTAIDVDYTCSPSREEVESLPEEMWFDDSVGALTPDKSKDYPGLNEDTKYLWAREQFIYSNKEPDIYYRIVSTFTAAEKASIIYSAGTFNEKVKYTRTDEQTPYIFDADGVTLNDEGKYDPNGKEYNYFVLKYSYDDELYKVNEIEGKYPSLVELYQKALNEDTKCNWERMESFNAIYSDIGVFKAATVGQFVFDDKYVFSQYGINKKSEPVHYTEFVDFDLSASGLNEWPTNIRQRVGVALAIESGHFIPNVLIDAQTGDVKFGHGSTFLENTGDGFLANGKIGWNNEGHVLIGDEENGFVSFKDGNMNISGDITLGAKSTGLAKLEEWIARNKVVDNNFDGLRNDLKTTNENVTKTTNALNEAVGIFNITQEELDEAQKELESTRKLLIEIIKDAKINKYELPQIKSELQNINSDYVDIEIQSTIYKLGETELWIAFNDKYKSYKTILEDIIKNFENNPEISEIDTPEGLMDKHNEYYESRINFLSAALSDAYEKVHAAQKAADDALVMFETLDIDISNLGSLGKSVEEINKKLDGTVMQYKGTWEPGFGVDPYSMWVESEDSLLDHVGDIYVDESQERSWRWCSSLDYNDTKGNEYVTRTYTVDDITSTYYFFWNEIIDANSAAALAKATEAVDLADGKRRVFVDTVTVPYDVGDLWSFDGDLFKCIKAKSANETYSRDDWDLATKYTDDSVVIELQNALNDDTTLTIIEKRNIRESISSITTITDPNGLVTNGVANGEGSFKTVYDELIEKELDESAENVRIALRDILQLLSSNKVWDAGDTTIDKYFRKTLNERIANYSKLTSLSFIPYTHTAYADDDKGTGFTTINSDNKAYFGQYSDYNPIQSQDHKKYKWTKIKGDPGDEGVGISSITNKYGVSNSETEEPNKWYDDPISTSPDNRYLWQKQTITLSKGNPKITTQIIGTHGETGLGIKNILNFYYASTSKNNYPSVSNTVTDNNWWSEDYILDHMGEVPDETTPYLFKYTKTVFSNDSIVNTVPIVVAHYTKGEKGDNGKIIYPAGKYSPNITYTSDDEKAPYVLDGEDYYVLKAKSFTGYSGGPTPSTDSTNWTKFEKFEAIYAKLALIDNGTFGDAVFNNRYMFSKSGKNKQGYSTEDYHAFSNTNPYGESNAFKPNYCVDFQSGTVWLNGGKTIFKSDGSGQLNNGKIKWDNSSTTISNDVKFTIDLEYPYMHSITCDALDGDDDEITEATWVYVGQYGCTNGNDIDLQNAHVWIHDDDLEKWTAPSRDIGPYRILITTTDYKNIENGQILYAYGWSYLDSTLQCFELGDPIGSQDPANYDTGNVYVGTSTYGNITDKIQSTEISGDKIKTGTIDAQRLNVKDVAAEMMKVGVLTVDTLNTTPLEESNAGRILIKDNDIGIFNNESEEKVVSISGSPVTNLSDVIDKQIRFGGTKTITFDTSKRSPYGGSLVTVSNNELDNGKTYIFNATVNYTIKVYPGYDSLYNLNDVHWQEWLNYAESNKDYRAIIIYYYNRELSIGDIYSMYEYGRSLIDGCTLLGYNSVLLKDEDSYYHCSGSADISINNVQLTWNSGYNIYVAYLDSGSYLSSTSNGTNLITSCSIASSYNENTVTVPQKFDCTELGSDGIQLMNSSQNYIKLQHSGMFEANNGLFRLIIDDSGIRIGKNEKKYVGNQWVDNWTYKDLWNLL